MTGHWINRDWQLQSVTLDIVHLLEPVHSSEYLAGRFLFVTDEFSVTEGLFTVTRDNAGSNDTMLAEIEAISDMQREAEESIHLLQQPWPFTVREGDVRCVAHIINLAVQAALTSLKVVPSSEVEAYKQPVNAARLLPSQRGSNAISALAKLQSHIYIFRNWRL